MKTELQLADEQASLSFGAQLADSIHSGIVYFEGLLGTGKTTVIRGWLRQLGYQGNVKSPTYTIVEPYEIAGRSILHVDLYRISDPSELEFIGLPEQIADSELVFLEWPQYGRNHIPDPDYTIHLLFDSVGRRVTCTC